MIISYLTRGLSRWPAIWALRLMTAVLCLSLASLSAWAAPVISAEQKMIDYGLYYSDEIETITRQFVIQNAGDETLVIKNIDTSCGCTRAEISSRYIPPGESATLDAAMHAKGRQGKQQIRITLISNDPANSHYELGLSGNLIARWTCEPAQVESFLLQSGETQVKEFRIIRQQKLGESPLSIVSATSDHPQVGLELIHPSTSEVFEGYSKAVYTCRAKTAAGIEASTGEKAILRLKTDDPANPFLSLGLAWIVEGDVAVAPRRLKLLKSMYCSGAGSETGANAKNTARIKLTSHSKTPFRILNAAAPAPFSVEWERDRSQAVHELVVSITGEEEISTAARLSIATDSPRDRFIEVALLGSVQKQGPLFLAEKYVHQAGSLFVDEARGISQTFTISNPGTRDLRLTLAEVSLGSATLEASSVVPCGSTTLTLTAATAGRSGPFETVARLDTNDDARMEAQFAIKGEILARWSLEPSVIDLKSVIPGVEEKARAILTQRFPSWEKPAQLKPIASDAHAVKVVPGSPKTAYHPQGYGTAATELEVFATPSALLGYQKVEVPLLADGVSGAEPVLKIEWDALGDIRARPTSLSLSSGGQPKPVSLRIYSRQGKPFTVTSLAAPAGILVEEIQNGRDGYEYLVSGMSSENESALLFNLDVSEQKQLRVKIQSVR